MKQVPDALNKIVDVVLAYRPKPKTEAARKRKRAKSALDRQNSLGSMAISPELQESLHRIRQARIAQSVAAFGEPFCASSPEPLQTSDQDLGSSPAPQSVHDEAGKAADSSALIDEAKR
jgi:hypothetical protein